MEKKEESPKEFINHFYVLKVIDGTRLTVQGGISYQHWCGGISYHTLMGVRSKQNADAMLNNWPGDVL